MEAGASSARGGQGRAVGLWAWLVSCVQDAGSSPAGPETPVKVQVNLVT